MEPVPTSALGEREIVVRIFEFPPDASAVSNWDDDTRCALHVEGDSQPTLHIVANVAGLWSLARHCLTLAQDGQEGGHVDYDADSGWFDSPDFGLRISRGWD
ncbi:hypothetical protein [Nocardioides sp. SYSU D00038]|uniref:Imm32 family immunity protein n=1 Tax=Nocardioides sp. SYSU D00038 TaxID=2812554 RepID=UPI0019671621|nr:hypothetical protein [Nocardioides sp. SYSU D00038]